MSKNAAKQKRYRERHIEECRRRNREWYQRNLESQRSRSRLKSAKAFAEKPEIIRERNRVWREENIEKFRAKDRRYHAENREVRNAQAKQYHAEHRNDPQYKKQHAVRSRKNYKENRTKILEQHKRWMAAHPGIQRVYSQKRRALEKSAAVNLKQIREWMLLVKSAPFAKCYYCELTVSTKRIHFEHMIPLNRGGAHSIENLCVSCKLCNLQKGTRHISEWDKNGQQILSL
jgi:5-methylcytosine-specific restriction endonuclease McrA